MIKLNLINGQIATERLIKSLEQQNFMLARSQLNNIKKNAYNKLYYAEKRFEETMPTGIEYQIQKAQIKQAKIEYAQIKNAVSEIRNYINRPEDYAYKNDRSNYYKLRRAFQRINYIEEKKKAEQKAVRAAQKEAGTVEGVTLLNIRKTQKMNALFENVLYNNEMFNFDKEGLNELAKTIQDITGYNVLEDLYRHFDTPTHYDSEGGSNNIPIYDEIQNISTKLKHMIDVYEDDEQFEELEKQIYEFLRMAGV